MSALGRQPPARIKALQLTLYVAQGSAASATARVHLQGMLDELGITLRPTVVDVTASPDEAMRERIFVTPALIIESALSREMVIGDLRLRAPVLDLLRALAAPGSPP